MSDPVKDRGVVFTPPQIAKWMVSLIPNKTPLHILEPSCGNGAILDFIPAKHFVTGIDINKSHIAACKKKFSHNHWAFIQNDFIKVLPSQKYDVVIGNPPYVRIQNMQPSMVTKMQKEYPDFIYGNTNLYAYFLVKCLDMLKDNGKLIFLIPNSLFYNKSLQRIKQYILEKRWLEYLIDFHEHQIFEGVSTYTCILVLTKNAKRTFYTLENGVTHAKQKVYYKTPKKIMSNRSFVPRIGIMTLCDDVFIIKDFTFINNNNTIQFIKHGKSYQIEADACMDILKVSKNAIYKIIYPYLNINKRVEIDLEFLQKYPQCARYLQEYKHVLHQRDNGNTSRYPAWYAYGRTQSLTPHDGKRLFLPTVVKNIKDSFFVRDVPLFYSGLWIEPQTHISISTMKQWLISHEKHILENSNHREGGWFALTHSSFDVS